MCLQINLKLKSNTQLHPDLTRLIPMHVTVCTSINVDFLSSLFSSSHPHTLLSGEVEKELEKFVELFDVSFAIIVCTLKYIIVDCEAQRKGYGYGMVM